MAEPGILSASLPNLAHTDPTAGSGMAVSLAGQSAAATRLTALRSLARMVHIAAADTAVSQARLAAVAEALTPSASSLKRLHLARKAGADTAALQAVPSPLNLKRRHNLASGRLREEYACRRHWSMRSAYD